MRTFTCASFLEKKSGLILGFFLLCYTTQGQQQNQFDNLRNIPAASPQAAAFAKYVDFPVSYYNGTPNISIPLYTVKSKDITLPINLTYHAGGIKVTQEASWVGLGWNVVANGTISRQICGKDDFLAPSNNYFGSVFPDLNRSYDETRMPLGIEYVCSAFNFTGQPIEQTYPGSQLFNLASNGDGEPDIFNYNFGSYSGRFLFNGTAYVDISRNNIKFDASPTSAKAITPDGTEYLFAVTEKGWVGSNPSSTMAYYLTKITSPLGKVVNFTYTTLNDVKQMPSWSEEYLVKYGTEQNANGSIGPLRKTRSVTHANLVYLANISFDEGSIDFVPSSRNDMYGNKLDIIRINYKDGTLFKKFTFNYSYFVGQSARHFEEVGFSYSGSAETYPLEYVTKRLKLLSIVEEGTGADQPLKHEFQYYEGGNNTLPLKSSFAQDFWGFFNGKNTNLSLIPDGNNFSYSDASDLIRNYDGENREADGAFITAGMLKKIIYPTKGSTEYEFAIHQYDNYSFSPIKYTWTNLPSITDTGVGVQQQTFTLATAKNVLIYVTLFCDCGGNSCLCSGNTQSSTWTCGNLQAAGYQPGVLYAVLKKLNPTTGQYEWISDDFTWDVNKILPCNASLPSPGSFTKNATLTPGTYRMEVNYPDSKVGDLGSKMASMTVGYVDSYFDLNPKGGGVRVSKITHTDNVNGSTLVRNYQYTGGLMMNFPNFYWRNFSYEKNPSGGDTAPNIYYQYKQDWLYGSSITPFSTAANGNLVGYSKVTEVISAGEIGKTEYQFENQIDNFNPSSAQASGGFLNAYAPGVPTTPHLKNGFLKQVSYYDNNNTLLKSTINTPVVAGAETFWSWKPGLMINAGEEWSNAPCNTALGQRFVYYYYPIQMGKAMVATTQEVNYALGTSQVVAKNFTYNTQALIKTEGLISSDGKSIVTEYKYPFDYYGSSYPWMADLQNKNMIGRPLEALTKVNGNAVSGSFLKFTTANSKTTPSELLQVELTAPTSIASTAPSGVVPAAFVSQGNIVYDADGNISSSNASNDYLTSYVWGYNKTYPIAVAKNAPSNQIFHTSFEETGVAFLDGSNNNIAKTGAKVLNSGSYTFVNFPPAGTTGLKMSYWYWNGTAWLYSGIKDFSATITAGQKLDEIRVYPADAQMTTATYDVLKGVTSQTDERGVTTYFEYDTFGRLLCVKDQNRSIVKTYKYHYQE